MASVTSFWSDGENALVGSGLPFSPLGEICAKAWLAQARPRLDRPVRIAGAPATMPSNSAG